MAVNKPDKADAGQPEAAGAADATPLPPEAKPVLLQLIRLLFEVSRLVDNFEMVVEAWHPGLKEKKTMTELTPLLATADGQAWLLAMKLRLRQTNAYPALWQKLLGPAMAQWEYETVTADVPDNTSVLDNTSSATRAAHSAEFLKEFLEENCLSQHEFAAALGVAQATVSRRLSGALPWTPEWQAQVRVCIERNPDLEM